MADEPDLKGDSRPVPDPTKLTTDLVRAAMEAEEKRVDLLMQNIDTRLAGMDTATGLRLAQVADLPSQMDEKDQCIKDVLDEKFRGVGQQFADLKERMAEQKKDTKDAVDAAFQAAKDAVNLQTEASEKSIAKSEASTTKQIDALGVQSTTAIEGLKDQITDLKLSVERITANKIGGVDQRSEIRNQTLDSRGLVAIGISAILVVIAVAAVVVAIVSKG